MLMWWTVPAVAQYTLHARSGNQLYKEKKFTEALPEYQKSLEENAGDPVLSYNLGNAYFRNEKFDEAIKAFDKPLAEGNESSLRQRAFYNKGVSLSKQSKLQESISAYKDALLLNPADNDARINLQKALLELKKKQQPENDKKEDEKNKKQKKHENPPPSQSKMSKKQVEQLLKALDQREQQVQQKMQQSRTRGVTKPEKDW
jgi:tetratricopeptide (TPR) repeat protein